MHQPGRFLLYFCLCGIILGGALLLQPGRALYGAGCTDVYDDNGNRVDTLTDHPVLAAVPAQISRSLCGFYDADYVEFPAEPGVAYDIQVLNHEDPARYGLYLELWQQQAPDQNHLLLSTAQGSVELTSPTTFTGNLVVRIGSLRSDTGSYGGGDYSLAITRQRSPQATPTVTPTRQPTTVPTVTATTAPTMTPTTTPTATPIITPTTTPTTKSPVMLSWRLLLPICLQSRLLERAY